MAGHKGRVGQMRGKGVGRGKSVGRDKSLGWFIFLFSSFFWVVNPQFDHLGPKRLSRTVANLRMVLDLLVGNSLQFL